MRFAASEEQRDLRALVHDVVARSADPHGSLAQVGVYGTLLAEEHGGLGLDETCLVAVATETGWGAVALPVVETVGVAPGVLAAAGSTGDLASGALLVGVGDPVRFGSRADLVLRGGFGGVGSIEVVRPTGREPVAAVDPRADLCRVDGEVLAEVRDPDVVEQAWARGVLGTAAQLTGLARRMLEMTVEHVRARTQFGVPVGSFQAVKHHLASATIKLEFAEPAVARAGWSLATGAPDRRRDVAMAKVLASEAATAMARTAIQCHGAIAYTTEYDLHLFAKRAWALAADWGTAAWHRAVVADELGLPRTGARPAA
ncbi:acyl-CoA dehydrogenase [Actinosynnema sp. NPDC020468]|uniref:acyl-CoA dehydrogenase family protein n=1 Tax=Actinosynnema sp. NPDC020468 TaxID=3154488 RepID=UPI0033C2369F